MNHHRTGRGPLAGRAVGPCAPASQPVVPGGQGAQGIGATLFAAARIARAHGGRQSIQPLFESVRIRGQQAPLNPRDPAFDFADPNVAVGVVLRTSPHRIGIGFGHDLVHLRAQPALGQRGPARHVGRQLPVHGSQYVGIGDQIGAIDQRLKHPEVDVTGLEDLAHPRQPLAQGPRVPQPAGRQPLADPQLRGHLGRHRRLGVDSPLLGLGTTREPMGEQPPDRGQLPGHRPILRPRTAAGLRQQRRRFGRLRRIPPLEQLIKPGNHLRRRHLRLEHAFDHATGV